MVAQNRTGACILENLWLSTVKAMVAQIRTGSSSLKTCVWMQADIQMHSRPVKCLKAWAPRRPTSNPLGGPPSWGKNRSLPFPYFASVFVISKSSSLHSKSLSGKLLCHFSGNSFGHASMGALLAPENVYIGVSFPFQFPSL